MEAVLNVYEGCESEEPKKTFVCRRLTFTASNAFEEIANEITDLEKESVALMEGYEEKSADEKKEVNAKVKEITALIYEKQVDIIKLFFPSFTSEDLGGLDPYEYQNFCIEIGKERSRILARAQKN